MPINNNILNQKGTPAFYSDIFANRPAFGYAGRVFISTDTGAIYEDTGTSWTLIADAGAGTTGTLQQVTTNGNTTTLGIVVDGININNGAGTGSNNIAIGVGALLNNTTGQANIAVGISTLQYNSTGYQNSAFGLGALQNNTTGGANTAIGHSALQENTTANFNTAIGFESLKLNTTGANNTAVGYASMTQNTTASNNTAIGYSSLNLNTTGTQNTAIGRSALEGNLTGGNNVAVGYNSLAQNSSGSTNTAIGVSALASNSTAGQNTAVGNSAMFANTTGSLNTAVGQGSLQLNITGTQNTAIGTSSLNSNTTANNNTGIGYSSLYANTTGIQNTAIGSASLSGNTTGNYNTAIGYSSLQSNTTGIYNTAIGMNALRDNLTANNNTAIGNQALYQNTTGTGNTAIGQNAGGSITTGNNNTLIGSYAGTTTLTSNIVLSDGLGNVRLFSDANGLIGINQSVGSVPGGQLDIHTSQTYALVLNGLTTSNAYTAFSNNNVGKWRIGNTYNAGANSFDIYNLGTSSTALSFDSTTNVGTFNGAIKMGNGSQVMGSGGLKLGIASGNAGAYLQFLGWSTAGYNFQIDTAVVSGYGLCFTPSTTAGGTTFTTPAMTILGNGRVGVGTTTPADKFNISNSGAEGIEFGFNTGSAYMVGYNRNASSFIPICLQQSSGNLLIGSSTDDTTNKLQVTGSAIFSGNVTIGSPTASPTLNLSGDSGGGLTYINFKADSNTIKAQITGEKYAGTGGILSFKTLQSSVLTTAMAITQSTVSITNLAGSGSRAVLADASGNLSAPVSDISVKENINTIGYGLNEILKMKPVWFNYNDEYKNYGEGRQNGNIAQEMEAIIPEAVFTTPSTNKMGINYDQLHAVYIKAIQELKAEIDALKNN
jgi:hypothetical protein